MQPSSEQVSAMVSMHFDAGICCWFVQDLALIYYRARRLTNVCSIFLFSTFVYNLLSANHMHDRKLCVLTNNMTLRVNDSTSRRDMLQALWLSLS